MCAIRRGGQCQALYPFDNETEYRPFLPTNRRPSLSQSLDCVGAEPGTDREHGRARTRLESWW